MPKRTKERHVWQQDGIIGENIIMRANEAQTRREDGTLRTSARRTASKQHDSSMQTASENGTRAQEGIITTSARPRLLIIGRTASGKDTLAEGRARLVESLARAMEEEGLSWYAGWERCWSARNAATGAR